MQFFSVRHTIGIICHTHTRIVRARRASMNHRTRAGSIAALAVTAALASSRSARADERPFAFADDARTPEFRGVDAFYYGTWGVVGSNGAVRPIGAEAVGTFGSVQQIGAEGGIAPRVSLRAYGLAQIGLEPGVTLATGGGEVRVRAIGENRGPFQLTFAGGALRQFDGTPALLGRIVASWSPVERLRVTADASVMHALRTGADAVDIVFVAGVSYRVVSIVRAGAEYIGQDLEAAFDPDEIEGVRHMAGPTLTFDIARERVQVVAAALFGLGPTSPPVALRLGALCSF
jgi:hypothetical protein